VHDYKGKDIIVRYDANRCIHAAECVSRLSAVFDNSRRRWVEVNNAPAEEVADAVTHCPTGALHFETISADGTGPEPEAVPVSNTITLVENGPLYVRGNVEVVADDGQVILNDTRVALCRCGQSKIKPLCDNSHIACGFKAYGTLRAVGVLEPEQRAPGDPPAGKLTIHVDPAGCYDVQGEVKIYGAGDVLIVDTSATQLCRCGRSEDKPFCDSSHRYIDF
jgi:CDGSH-type Zn-finger protein/uncharacterized Fe-S cluster protein YjdI